MSMEAASTPIPVVNVQRTPLYEGSSQYRHWRFSPEELSQTRRNLNVAAVSAIRDAFEADSPGSSSGVLFLNADDEHLLVKLYVSRVAQLCGHFRFPEEVEATAVTYLKRFYLKNTVMDWHPKNVMLTALFLATKTTNHPISLETYASHIPRTAPSDVLELEFLVAQSLGFDFAVWHAHRALWGIYLDIQQSLPDIGMDELRTAYEVAIKHVRASRLTDVELIYTPSQIALACLLLASPSLASAWARSKYGSPGSSPSPPQSPLPLPEVVVLDLLGPLKDLITTNGTTPDVEAVREVDRRLKLCKNPEKVVGSNAYRRKHEEAERRAAEKRSRKADLTRKAIADGDPFGNELAGQELEDDDD